MAVIPCPKCGRVTPTRHDECVYCLASLKGANQAGTSPPPPATGGRKKRKANVGHEEPRLLGSDKARFQRKSTEEVHVLIVGTGEPIEISAGKLFVIGRDPRASLVVHYPEVSRQHAEIDWDDRDPPMPILSEIRSRNGTYLNGARVAAGDPRPIRSGDEIRLGEAFRMLYLCVSPRDLRIQIQESGQGETRAFSRGPDGSLEAPADSLSAGSDEGELGDLVAAALGEADLTSLDTDGDFSKQHGKFLVKRLYTQRQSGILTVYDGTDVGEMLLVEGRCRSALLGMLGGREALEYVARLDRGRYRFRSESLDVLLDAPPPAEVDDHGLSLSGDFKRTVGADVIRDLVSRRASGVLTVFDSMSSGQVILLDGICQDAVLGKTREREALDGIVRLQRGVYRFRPADADPLPPTRDSVPIRRERATSAVREEDPYFTQPYADEGPLRRADSETGVVRRSTTPVRAPRPREPRTGMREPRTGMREPRTGGVRRQPPPPPRRRRAPPPPPMR
jgi:hypothetical protein